MAGIRTPDLPLKSTVGEFLVNTDVGPGMETGRIPIATAALQIKTYVDEIDGEVSVLSFGADPTGVANSSSAFQAAMTAIGSWGKVNVPAGTYKLDTALTGNANWCVRYGVTLTGASPDLPGIVSRTGKTDWTATTAEDGKSLNIGNYPKTSYFGDNILGVYSGDTVALVIPPTPSIFAAYATSTYVQNKNASTFGVGVFGGATVGAASTNTWAANFLASNSPTIQPHNGTGFNFVGLFGLEIDVNIQKVGAAAPTGASAGLYLNGIFEAQPTGNFPAILIDAASKPISWKTGILFADGAVSDFGVFLATQAIGNNTASQLIGWASRTAGGVVQVATQSYGVDQFHTFTGGLRSTLVNGSVEHKPATGPAVLSVSPDQAAQVATVNFLDAGTLKWQAYKDTDNSFNIFDWVQGVKALEITSAGHVTLGETGKTTALLGQALANTGTIAGSTPFIFSQTWNAGAVAFSGFEVGITDTASAAASYPFRVKVGGSDIFSVKKDGTVTAAGIVVSDGVYNGADKVLGARKTGWGAPSGTFDRTTLAAYAGQTVSAAYVQAEAQATDNAIKKLSQVVAALINDLHASGTGSPTHMLLEA